MLTSRMKRDIAFRLGPLVKYTVSGPFCWNNQLDKFVRVPVYFYWSWYASYYAAQCFQLLFLLYLYTYTYFEDIPEELLTTKNSDFSEQERFKTVTILAGLIFWFIITTCLAVNSILLGYGGDEFSSLLNQEFSVDLKLKGCISDCQNVILPWSDKCLKFETFVKFVCYAPLLIPLIFFVSFFHASDPVRNLFKHVFEIDLSPTSFSMWFAVSLEFWGILALAGNLISIIIVALVSAVICRHWFGESMPTGHAKYFGGKMYFQTANFGSMSENSLILIYRTLFLITKRVNLGLATVNFAYHTFGMLSTSVLSCYALISYHNVILDGTLMGVSMFCIFLITFYLTVFIFFMECYLVDLMESNWKEFKSKLIFSTVRTKCVYKSALSFQQVALKTTYPFCNVNKSTFLDFCDALVNNLVNLLVM